MNKRTFGRSGLEVSAIIEITEAELRDLNVALGKNAISGDRYPPEFAKRVGR